MKSPVVKRSIVIAGHKTSVSLEDAFWKGLKDIAIVRQVTLSDLVASIDTERRHGNLSSAIRLFVLDHYRAQSGNADDRPGAGAAAARNHADAAARRRRSCARNSRRAVQSARRNFAGIEDVERIERALEARATIRRCARKGRKASDEYAAGFPRAGVARLVRRRLGGSVAAAFDRAIYPTDQERAPGRGRRASLHLFARRLLLRGLSGAMRTARRARWSCRVRRWRRSLRR